MSPYESLFVRRTKWLPMGGSKCCAAGWLPASMKPTCLVFGAQQCRPLLFPKGTPALFVLPSMLPEMHARQHHLALTKLERGIKGL